MNAFDALSRGIAAVGAVVLVVGLAASIVAGGWLVYLGTYWLDVYLTDPEARAATLLLVGIYVVIVGVVIYSLGDLRAEGDA